MKIAMECDAMAIHDLQEMYEKWPHRYISVKSSDIRRYLSVLFCLILAFSRFDCAEKIHKLMMFMQHAPHHPVSMVSCNARVMRYPRKLSGICFAFGKQSTALEVRQALQDRAVSHAHAVPLILSFTAEYCGEIMLMSLTLSREVSGLLGAHKYYITLVISQQEILKKRA